MGAAEKDVISTGRRDEIVLALTADGREELRHPQAGLSLRQRKLLMLIDGKRSLQQIVSSEPTLHADRVARDAAALVGRGLVEIEKGLLQPIAHRSTEMPAATLAPPTTGEARQVRGQPSLRRDRAAKEKKAASGPRPTVWLALAAGGAIAVLAAYLMQPRSAPPGVGAASAPPQPIASVPPARPIAQAAVGPAQPVARPTEPAAAGAVAATAINTQANQSPPPAPTAPATAPVASPAPPERGSNTKVAAVPIVVPPPEVKPAASGTIATASPSERGATTNAVVEPATRPPSDVKPANSSTVAIQSPSQRGSTANAAVEPATVSPSEVKPANSSPVVADAPPAAATAAVAVVVAAPAQTAAPAASETSAARAPAPPAAPETTAAIAAWTRDFAPVAPDASDPRMVALTSGLSPIERVPPVYPREAVREGITQGSIRARAVLAANGRVERVEFPALDSRNRVFERPARAALMMWTFPPGERGRVYEVVLNFVAP